jgi:hypothetical protein
MKKATVALLPSPFSLSCTQRKKKKKKKSTVATLPSPFLLSYTQGKRRRRRRRQQRYRH